MKPCFNCETFDGKNKNSKTIALQSTRYGPLCCTCIDGVASWLFAKKKGGM